MSTTFNYVVVNSCRFLERHLNCRIFFQIYKRLQWITWIYSKDDMNQTQEQIVFHSASKELHYFFVIIYHQVQYIRQSRLSFKSQLSINNCSQEISCGISERDSSQRMSCKQILIKRNWGKNGNRTPQVIDRNKCVIQDKREFYVSNRISI